MKQPASKLKLVLAVAVIALIVRVLYLILIEYRFYFPPDFDQSFFLAGRRPTFAGWYSIGFYTHIVSGPIAMVLVVTLLVTGQTQRFKTLHRSCLLMVQLTSYLKMSMLVIPQRQP